MQLIEKTKGLLIDFIKSSEYGNRKLYQFKSLLGKGLSPDMAFPELISLEVSSICNLSCIHCPPHIKEFIEATRKHTHMDYDLFNRMMDEIDLYGKREIALHKDGEPLIHPEIIKIIERVKKSQPHYVYITTNGHYLKPEITDAILANKIDTINFSIGAYSEEFYGKVRGRGFDKVISNIKSFLESVLKSNWKPKITVQIINLPEYNEMKSEIKEFKKYWADFDAEIDVWEKLTWGTLPSNEKFRYRYPCYSLWNSVFINSNGIVTPCCMDWKQELDIGNVANESIKEIWAGKKLRSLRETHINNKEHQIDICNSCNYWKWQPMLLNYDV